MYAIYICIYAPVLVLVSSRHKSLLGFDSGHNEIEPHEPCYTVTAPSVLGTLPTCLPSYIIPMCTTIRPASIDLGCLSWVGAKPKWKM